MKRSLLLLFCLALPAALGTGCSGARINLRPLYYSETRPSEKYPGQTVRNTDVLYPFFSTENEEGRHYHALRPIYNYERLDREKTARTQFIWPFGLYKSRENDQWLLRFWPLFMHSTTRNSVTGGWNSHGSLLIFLVMWGHRVEQGNYFSVFPIGGVTHGLLGDTFSYVLFPIYSYYRQSDYVRHNVLWPIFTVGGTPDEKRSLLRIWPFYVRYREQKEGSSRLDRYILWPFFRWSRTEWDTPRHGSFRRIEWALVPIFAWMNLYQLPDRLVGSTRNFIPLFGTTGDDRQGKERDAWQTLFGLIKWESTPRRDERKIFPFFWQHTFYSRGSKPREGDPDAEQKPVIYWRRTRAPWPLVWLDYSNRQPDHTSTDVVVAPLYWQHAKHYTRGEFAGNTERTISLWPLFSHRQGADGSRGFWIASYGWSDASEGYKRNMRAFFDLFEYRARADGYAETRALWRLYEHRRGPQGRLLMLGPLFSYDSIGDLGDENRKSWSVLFGLIKRSWSEDDARWRILYIPF